MRPFKIIRLNSNSIIMFIESRYENGWSSGMEYENQEVEFLISRHVRQGSELDIIKSVLELKNGEILTYGGVDRPWGVHLK